MNLFLAVNLFLILGIILFLLIKNIRPILYWITGFLPCKVINGPDGNSFLERYHIANIAFLNVLIVLHRRFVDSDPDRGFHDHPWQWAVSLILDGEYTELIIPHKDASISERYVRTKRAFELNSIDPTQYHRVLLPPGKDCWTLFVMGPRNKIWGFLAQKEAHRFPSESSNDNDHYNRPGIERKLSSSNACDIEADINFKADLLEYRPYTTSTTPTDFGWWDRSPTGNQARKSGIAKPLSLSISNEKEANIRHIVDA